MLYPVACCSLRFDRTQKIFFDYEFSKLPLALLCHISSGNLLGYSYHHFFEYEVLLCIILEIGLRQS